MVLVDREISFVACLFANTKKSHSICCSFGYVVEGEDFLRDIKEGDVIVSAKVTDGIKNLVRPQ